MSNTHHLFIGGPLDGQRIAVPDGQRLVEHPENGKIFSYTLEQFAFADRRGANVVRVMVFIPETWPDTQAITHLFENYGRKS
jgi:hypothetical protein